MDYVPISEKKNSTESQPQPIREGKIQTPAFQQFLATAAEGITLNNSVAEAV